MKKAFATLILLTVIIGGVFAQKAFEQSSKSYRSEEHTSELQSHSEI